MRGFPKTVATKQDILNLKDKYPKETKKFLEKIIALDKKYSAREDVKKSKCSFSFAKKMGFISVEEAKLVLHSINMDLLEPGTAKLFKFK